MQIWCTSNIFRYPCGHKRVSLMSSCPLFITVMTLFYFKIWNIELFPSSSSSFAQCIYKCIGSISKRFFKSFKPKNIPEFLKDSWLINKKQKNASTRVSPKDLHLALHYSLLHINDICNTYTFINSSAHFPSINQRFQATICIFTANIFHYLCRDKVVYAMSLPWYTTAKNRISFSIS